MATWQEQRTLDFVAMQAEWGVTLTRNGLTATGIKSPDIVDKMMRESNYLTDTRAVFDLSRDDWTRLGLGSRAQFSCGDVSYEVTIYRDDASDPVIQFSGARLK